MRCWHTLIPVFISMTARPLVAGSNVAWWQGRLSVFLPVNLLYAGSLSSEVPSNLFAVVALWLLVKGILTRLKFPKFQMVRFCETACRLDVAYCQGPATWY